MRYIRIPYRYLSDFDLESTYAYSGFLLRLIRDLHHDIPNEKMMKPAVRPHVEAYMYHASFIRWIFVRSYDEQIRRNRYLPFDIGEDIINLRSRSISDFLPPKDNDIADDVVYLFQQWSEYERYGGEPIPRSYLDLAKAFHGYDPPERTCERIDDLSGRHYKDDTGWYRITSEEEAKINNNPLAARVRSGFDAAR